MSALVQIYLKKIQNGSMELENVPAKWRSEVSAELEKVNSKEE